MNIFKWIWPGVLTTLVMTVIVAIIAAPAIETELNQKATDTISKTEIDWSTVELDGRDLTLSGVAPLPQQVATAIELTENVVGVRVVDNRTTLLPEQKPYKFAIIRDADNLSLEGYSPNNKSHAQMLSNFNKNEFSPVDNTSLGRGALDNHDEIASFMATKIKYLKSGKVSLEGNKLTISGIAHSKTAFQTLQKELAETLPAGIMLAGNDVAIPTYNWTLSKKGNEISLTGSAPNPAMKAKISEMIAEKYGDRYTVDNQLLIADGAPAELELTVLAAIQTLTRLKNATYSLVDENFTVVGDALTPIGAKQASEQIVSMLPTSIQGKVDFGIYEILASELVPAETCQSMLSQMMVGNSIEFESGKAAINPKSFALLDQLVYTTRLCPKSRVEIEGHSDSDGNDDANQVLSEARANAVRKFLSGNGVKSNRLDAVGYGEVRPIANNSTAEGKAKNRRIEFRILQN